MLQTAPISNSLNLNTNQNILKRINTILRSNALEHIFIQWLQDSISSKEFYKYSRDTQNELLDTLYEFSQTGGELAERAEKLYVEIISWV